jgi:hypothetical protein
MFFGLLITWQQSFGWRDARYISTHWTCNLKSNLTHLTMWVCLFYFYRRSRIGLYFGEEAHASVRSGRLTCRDRPNETRARVKPSETKRRSVDEVDANPGRHLHVVEMGVNRVDLCVWGAPAEARRRCLSSCLAPFLSSYNGVTAAQRSRKRTYVKQFPCSAARTFVLSGTCSVHLAASPECQRWLRWSFKLCLSVSVQLNDRTSRCWLKPPLLEKKNSTGDYSCSWQEPDRRW